MTARHLDFSSPWLSILQNYNNVKIILVDTDTYFSNTPLEKWYQEGEWRTSLYKIVHLSDYLRVLTLWRGGGMYMDLDYITLKPLDERVLWNFFFIETAETILISNFLFHLEYNHRIISALMQSLVELYDPGDYILHGPKLVSAVMSRLCGVRRGRPNSNNCTDVRLLSHNNFAPISNAVWRVFFKDATAERLAQVNNGSYGVHCWGGKTVEEVLDVQSNQLYAVLAREHCPLTVARAGEFLF